MQILSRLLAVVLAIVPLTLVLTAAAWRPLDESVERVESAAGSWAEAEAATTRSPLAPREGPFAED